MRPALTLSLSLAAGAVGCVPTFDDNLPLIVEPTVLALQAEPAEVLPGKDVQLSALVGTPEPNGATPKRSRREASTKLPPILKLARCNPSFRPA